MLLIEARAEQKIVGGNDVFVSQPDTANLCYFYLEFLIL